MLYFPWLLDYSVCLLLTGSFPINTPRISKDPMHTVRICALKEFCFVLFFVMVISCSPGTKLLTLWYIHEPCSNSALFLLKHRPYPVTPYQFLHGGIQGIPVEYKVSNRITHFIENQGYFKINNCIHIGAWGW